MKRSTATTRKTGITDTPESGSSDPPSVGFPSEQGSPSVASQSQ